MKVRINNCYGEMEMETKVRSSFDQDCAGQNIEGSDEYVIVLRDHKTHEFYCVSYRNCYKAYYESGRSLEDGEEATVISGNLVRPMTFSEERLWNEDRFMANVDIWGNIEVNDTFYMENLITLQEES